MIGMMVGIYAREDSDKKRLCEYCQIMNWKYMIYFNLDKLLNDVHSGKINVVIVESIDKFSTESSIKLSPCLIWKNLNDVVRVYGCRFISLEDGVDSNKVMWESSVAVAIANNPKIKNKIKKGPGRPMITDVSKMSRMTKWRRKKLGLL